MVDQQEKCLDKLRIPNNLKEKFVDSSFIERILFKFSCEIFSSSWALCRGVTPYTITLCSVKLAMCNTVTPAKIVQTSNIHTNLKQLCCEINDAVIKILLWRPRNGCNDVNANNFNNAAVFKIYYHLTAFFTQAFEGHTIVGCFY